MRFLWDTNDIDQLCSHPIWRDRHTFNLLRFVGRDAAHDILYISGGMVYGAFGISLSLRRVIFAFTGGVLVPSCLLPGLRAGDVAQLSVISSITATLSVKLTGTHGFDDSTLEGVHLARGFAVKDCKRPMTRGY